MPTANAEGATTDPEGLAIGHNYVGHNYTVMAEGATTDPEGAELELGDLFSTTIRPMPTANADGLDRIGG